MKRALRKIFRPKRDEEAGGWREVQIRRSSLRKISYALLRSASYMPRHYHHPQLDHSNNILREMHIMKPLTNFSKYCYSNQIKGELYQWGI
jgi:hypothetical protein